MHPKLQSNRARGWFLLYLAYRMNLAHHRGMAVLTIVAVAAAAALATGLEIASRGVREQLHDTARGILGGADLEIVGTPRALPESLAESVAAIDGVFEASPTITEVFRLTGAPLEGVALTVLGLDLLERSESRELSVSRDRVKIRDPLRLLAKPNSIVVARSLADRLGVREGESLRVRSSAGTHDLVIEGLIERGGLGDAYGGQIGVMDVWALQHLLDSRGYVDKVEIRARTGSDLDALATTIRSEVGAVAQVRRVMERDTQLSQVLDVLEAAAIGIAVLAALIATLLAFAAISHVVDSRISDFALMRCAGMDERGVRRLIVVDAVLLSCVGAVLGVVFGTLLSGPVSQAFSRMSEHLSRVPISNSNISFSTLAAGGLLGIVIALAAGARPARRAGLTSPLEFLPGASSNERASPRPARLIAAGAFALALVAAGSFNTPPSVRLALVVLLGLGLVLLVADRAVALVLFALRGRLGTSRGMLELAGSTVLAPRRGRTLPIAIVATVVAGSVAVLVVLDSITSSFDADIERRYRAGAAVYPGDPALGVLQGSILEETLDVIRATPGVKELAIYYNSVVPNGDQTLTVVALSADVLFRRGGLNQTTDHPSTFRDGLLRGEVAVSQGFERRFGTQVGDSIELQTRSGLRRFRVCSIQSAFGGRAPAVFLDVATFDANFIREGASFVGLWTSAPLEGVLEDISRRTAALQPLFFRHGAALRTYARSVAGRFLGLLFSLGALCVLLSSIGLVSLLSGAVVAGHRDLSIMSSSGATPREIGALVLIDACVIIALGTAGGVVLGVAWGQAALDLLAAEFGGTLTLEIEMVKFCAVVGGIGLASALACLVPARIASRTVSVGLPPAL